MKRIVVRLSCLLVSHLLVFFSGYIVSAGLSGKVSLDEKQVTVRSLEGSAISHDNFRTDSRNITFITRAEGKGSAETTIPKDIIPEAHNWMERKNTIEAGYIREFADRTSANGVYIHYTRRFDIWGIGVGAHVSGLSTGIRCGGLYFF